MINEISRWADEAMYKSEPIGGGDAGNAGDGPRVYLVSATPDPLGEVASVAKIYRGEVCRDKADVTVEEREYYFEQMLKTTLNAPFEFVQFHFLFEGVTRAFTHQLVRTRNATYAQESLRFAVKEDLADGGVGLPPGLQDTLSKRGRPYIDEVMYDPRNAAERQRDTWDHIVDRIKQAYDFLINSGMPAEDARGLLPTNTLTRVHMRIDLANLLKLAGLRLSTQAQWEWRLVFARLVKALRNAGAWQFNMIADQFKPICFQTGKCEFNSDIDRYCSIRDRVNAFHEAGIPPGPSGVNWERGASPTATQSSEGINGIAPHEWLADPSAARRS